MSSSTVNLSGLSPEKRALLEARLLRQRPSDATPAASLQSNVLYPLSDNQASLWFMDRLESNSALYNIPEAIRLSGPLNVPALTQALETIVARHGAIRTKFVACNGQPMQLVRDSVPFTVSFLDLSPVEPNQRDTETAKQIEAEAKRPFNLSEDVLLRATLLKLTDDEHVLLLTMHHIIGDLWSFVVLHQELTVLYEAYSAGRPCPLPPLRTQFAAMTASKSQAAHHDENLTFWKEKLKGATPVLDLATNKPRPSMQTYPGRRHHFQLSSLLLGKLKELSQEEGCTLYMALLAAFGAVLHRYSGQEDIIIGSPLSGRNSTDAENLIGYFINTLPLRLDFSGDPTFQQLLKRVRETTLGAFAHQDVPLPKIIEALQIERPTDRSPLFQTVFQYQAVALQPVKLAGVNTTLLPAETDTAKFDLTLTVAEGSEGLVGNFEYNTDLFECGTIERMAGHFQSMLENVAWNPEKAISTLPILTDAEQNQILIEWNSTQSPYPRKSTIHELFQQQAENTPDAIAVISENGSLTYSELNRRANQLAHHLVRLGVREDCLVGFCVERSLEMIIGLLGILKAGGAYVTLDPNYPRERLQYMFEDTSTPVFVTTAKFKDLASATAKVVCLDVDAETIQGYPATAPECHATSHHLAYAIYTSGSTGKPKGVLVPHCGVARLVKETNYLTFSPDDVFLQFAPISFDASTLELWGPLLNGGKLVLFPPHFESLEQLGQIIQQYQVTTLWLTAGLFHQMVDHHIDTLRSIRWLLAGGDVLSVSHVQKALRQLPGTRLINGYGPTENTTFTCCYPIPPNWNGCSSVPIGKPISQTTVYILDKQMQPVPIGVPGELFIGGDGLAREYLNARELTAQKFVSNPFTTKGKLYRTGDRVRWLPDGNIEFLGRSDFQVKIRGFRVELGEIETALVRNSRVRAAAVVTREDKSATRQLIAYIVPEKQHSAVAKPEAADIRNFLEGKLPAHMIPSRFVFLEELPLNTNGKVDRTRLPEPASSDEPAAQNAGPRNAVEQKLVDIWREVLGISSVGIQDNFFELGGHSLLATRLISRIASLLEVELPLRAIFESPTIATMAEAIARIRQCSKPQAQPILRRRSAPAERPITQSQQPSPSSILNL